MEIYTGGPHLDLAVMNFMTNRFMKKKRLMPSIREKQLPNTRRHIGLNDQGKVVIIVKLMKNL